MVSIDSNVEDRLKRPLRDLRISVTDRCNFRCTYCMPKEIFGPDHAFLPKQELLTFEEIVRVTRQFTRLGVRKIRLTGGEPLLRTDLPELVRQLNEVEGIEDIALTTNGVLLPKFAKPLKEAGLKRVSISLDALDNDIFGKMNGQGVKVDKVLKGIDAALEAGLGVKINTVLKKGLNDSQVLPMARYFKNKGVILRFIEFMDVGTTNGWNMDSVVSQQEVLDKINPEMPLEPIDPNYYGEVAARYRYKDGEGEIGFISSVTQAFCGTCTRARLSADGKIYTCLFASGGHDVRKLVRSDMTDSELTESLASIWLNRHDRYSELRSKGIEPKDKIEMSYIGG